MSRACPPCQRGRSSALAAAAVRIADAEAWTRIPMRRVAAEPSCGTVSLYSYAGHRIRIHRARVLDCFGPERQGDG
ncbi:hypothetical protein [Streptomyces sp. NPDC059861]|uniref:hypothetical protein n=1 Tax=Streptomyces sp. NPDC059861 TaxID=3346974 RepID=UPI003650E07B